MSSEIGPALRPLYLSLSEPQPESLIPSTPPFGRSSLIIFVNRTWSPRPDLQIPFSPHVLKRTDSAELASSFAYRWFLGNDRSYNRGIPIQVPHAEGIDLATHTVHWLNQSKNLTDETVGKIWRTFHTFLSSHLVRERFEQRLLYPEEEQSSEDPSRPCALPQVLIQTEKVEGIHFSQFIYQYYTQMSEEQRQKLFHSLGRIVLIDLILGNSDRLFQVHEEHLRVQEKDPQVQEKDLNIDLIRNYSGAANLENLMVSRTPDGQTTLVLIDNAVDAAFITDDINRGLYTKYLTQLFKKTSTFIAEQIFRDLFHEIRLVETYAGVEMNVSGLPPRQKTLDQLREDRDSICIPRLAEGITGIRETLRTHITPKFKEDRQFKEHLDNLYPEFASVIQTRLSLLSCPQETRSDQDPSGCSSESPHATREDRPSSLNPELLTTPTGRGPTGISSEASSEITGSSTPLSYEPPSPLLYRQFGQPFSQTHLSQLQNLSVSGQLPTPFQTTPNNKPQPAKPIVRRNHPTPPPQ